MGPDSVNGKKYWNHKRGKFSMWYLPKKSSKGGRWIIGKSKNLGKKMGSIISPEDVDKPQKATTWKYFNGSIWKLQPRNVIVSAILSSKNSAKTPKRTPKQTPKRTPKRTPKKTPKQKSKKQRHKTTQES
jgi:hypothetical protein